MLSGLSTPQNHAPLNPNMAKSTKPQIRDQKAKRIGNSGNGKGEQLFCCLRQKDLEKCQYFWAENVSSCDDEAGLL